MEARSAAALVGGAYGARIAICLAICEKMLGVCGSMRLRKTSTRGRNSIAHLRISAYKVCE
jgi:hypothetical protein